MHFLEAMERDIDWQREYDKLEHIVVVERVPQSYGTTTLNEWIESSFRKWKNRGNYTSFRELREHLGFPCIGDSYQGYRFAQGIDQPKYFLYCEMIVNLSLPRMSSYKDGISSKYEVFIMTVQANLKKTGYMWKKIEDQYIIIKEDAVAIEVAESLPELSDIILEYNHYRLKGNISRKRQILNQIAFVLEPIRNDLDSVCKKEISDFFFMVNNMNIRHNNCDPKVPG